MPGGRPKGDPNHQRRGKGAGWGGPPKGEGNKGAGPGRGITGKSVAELMALQGARETAADRWLAILNDPNHPHHATMIAKAAERLDGAAAQTIRVADVRPEDMSDEELAAIAARGRRRSAAASEGDAD